MGRDLKQELAYFRNCISQGSPEKQNQYNGKVAVGGRGERRRETILKLYR